MKVASALFVVLVVLFFAGSTLAGTGQYCTQISCLNRGDTCRTTAICTTCTSAYTTCVTNAGASTGARCSCYGDLWTCVANSPQCAAYVNAYFSSCNAGFPSYNCTTNCTHSLTAPTDTQYCGDVSYCDSTTSKCTAKHQTGACLTTNPGECGNPNTPDFTGYACDNSTGTGLACRTIGFGVTGDSCNGNGDCQSKICTNGICAAITGTCGNSNVCPVGQFCSSGSCVAQNAPGATCPTVSGEDGCGIGYTCGIGGTCIKYFAVADGGACDVRTAAECGLNSYCKRTTANLFPGVCTASPTTSVSCYNATDCAAWGPDARCACNFDASGSCYLSNAFTGSCTTEANNLVTCAQNAGCRWVLNPSSSSCLYQKCGNQINCYLTCGTKTNTANTCPSDVIPTYTCKKSSASSISFGIFLLAALLFVVAF